MMSNELYLSSILSEKDKLRWKVKRFFIHTRRNVMWALHTPKHWYERAKYGVSYRDLWNFDRHVSKVLARGLSVLAETKHGVALSYFQDPSGEDSTEDTNTVWQLQRRDFLDQAEKWKNYTELVENMENIAEYEKVVGEMFEWMKKHYGELWD